MTLGLTTGTGLQSVTDFGREIFLPPVSVFKNRAPHTFRRCAGFGGVVVSGTKKRVILIRVIRVY